MVLLLPLGIIPWVMGSRYLASRSRGPADEALMRLTRMGRVIGISAIFVGLGSAAYATLALERGLSHSTHADGTTIRRTHVGFRTWSSDLPAPDFSEYEYDEIQRPDGTWVKHGRSTRRSRAGMMLEEGTYRDGLREGAWTFWRRDGSVDPELSGVYEKDFRIQALAVSGNEPDAAVL
ncbi:MAG: hypothetical protein ACKVXR_02235 [Planctomycetota bacterium]